MSRLPFRLMVAACSLLLAASTSSCTTFRNALGTHNSACFRVLPTSQMAVGAGGTYSGLQYAPADSLLNALRNGPGGMRNVPAALAAAARDTLCLVEYRGQFTTAEVEDGWSPPGLSVGHYAIVVVRESDDSVVATVVVDHEPLRFRRTFPHL